jgi:hypothetical protein
MIRSLCLLATTLALGAVEIANGDMTLGDQVPTGWSSTWTPDATRPVTAVRDTTVFKSEPASLRFENPKGAPFANVSVPLAVTSGDKLKLGAGMRIGTGVKRATFALQCRNSSGTQTVWQEIIGGEPGEQWKTGLVLVTIPEGTSSANLILLLDGEGSVWLDDVTVAAQE